MVQLRNLRLNACTRGQAVSIPRLPAWRLWVALVLQTETNSWHLPNYFYTKLRVKPLVLQTIQWTHDLLRGCSQTLSYDSSPV